MKPLRGRRERHPPLRPRDLPLMANLYLVCVLLDTVFALGDFNATYFVSGGGPAMSTEVLATLGIRYAYTVALPRLGVAEVMTALPVLIPLSSS